MKQNSFPGFAYAADQLSAFCYSEGVFVITTRSNELITVTRNDGDEFFAWLVASGVRNVKAPNRCPVIVQQTVCQISWYGKLLQICLAVSRKISLDLMSRMLKREISH
jgi:hypothetical protein